MSTTKLKQAPHCFLLVISLSISICSIAQVGTRNATSRLDGNAVPLDHVRVDDVLWMKTVWQRIDLREKMNHRLFFPESPTQDRYSLFDYMIRALTQEPSATAYSTGSLGFNDMFDIPLKRKELDDLLIRFDTVPTPSLTQEGVYDTVIVENRVKSSDIIAYDLKEVWFINKHRSVMEVRLIGICPVMAVYNDDSGEYRGTKRLFWVYYPEMEESMSQWPVYDPRNDLQYISYHELFTDRRFSSRIVKISNVYDRYISEYQNPMDALVESAKLKEEIRDLELDMWSY